MLLAKAVMDLANNILVVYDITMYLYDLAKADSAEDVIYAATGIFNIAVGISLSSILNISNVNEVWNTNAGANILELEYTVVNYFAEELGKRF